MTLNVEADSRPATARSWSARLYRWGALLILLDVLVGGTILGVQCRRWAWDFTQLARFRGDITRNYDFGNDALQQGYLNLYENQALANPPEDKKINYTPLRLALFTAWAKCNQWRFGDQAAEWQESHEFNAFLMYYNTTIEWLAAIGAFLLVRHWIWRSRPPDQLPNMTWLDRAIYGTFRATLAFLILWFNPAVIVSAHGWPSTDMWVIPFFIWTVLLASWEWWFVAGLVMGVGGMFKGQQFFVVAIFMLWPIFAGQLGRALRFACGFALASAVVVSGWMLTYRADQSLATPERLIDWNAVLWVAGVAAAVGLANVHRLLPAGRKWLALVPVALAAGLILWPALGQARAVTTLAVMAAVVIASALLLKKRAQGYVLAGAVGASLLLCMAFFHGGTAWWTLGFEYGTQRHMYLVVGPGNNLCALLGERFGWYSPTQIAMTIPAGWFAGLPLQERQVELRELLITVYAALMVISCIAIARQWRRNDRQFLVAIVVPWLLFYSIPAQIHERYLLFGSGVAAIVIGCSFGLELLNIFLIVLTAIQTLNCMQFANGLQYNMAHRWFNADFNRFCETIRPDISWAVLAATGVFFFAAFSSSRWSQGKVLKPAAAAG